MKLAKEKKKDDLRNKTGKNCLELLTDNEIGFKLLYYRPHLRKICMPYLPGTKLIGTPVDNKFKFMYVIILISNVSNCMEHILFSKL